MGERRGERGGERGGERWEREGEREVGERGERGGRERKFIFVNHFFRSIQLHYGGTF